MVSDIRLLTGCLITAFAAVALPASARTETAPNGGDAAAASKGEQRLAALLQGRVAGEPVRCVRDVRNLPLRTVSRTAYLYGAGDTVWVQRTHDPRQIGFPDLLVIDSLRDPAAGVCRDDKARRIDRDTGLSGGIVRFGDFVPYTRVRPEAAGEG
jgi:hypothetical protein